MRQGDSGGPQGEDIVDRLGLCLPWPGPRHAGWSIGRLQHGGPRTESAARCRVRGLSKPYSARVRRRAGSRASHLRAQAGCLGVALWPGCRHPGSGSFTRGEDAAGADRVRAGLLRLVSTGGEDGSALMQRGKVRDSSSIVSRAPSSCFDVVSGQGVGVGPGDGAGCGAPAVPASGL